MGYTDVDKLAINTIRLLAVSFNLLAHFRFLLPLHRSSLAKLRASDPMKYANAYFSNRSMLLSRRTLAIRALRWEWHQVGVFRAISSLPTSSHELRNIIRLPEHAPDSVESSLIPCLLSWRSNTDSEIFRQLPTYSSISS